MNRERMSEMFSEALILLDVDNRYGYLFNNDKGIKTLSMLMILEEIFQDKQLASLFLKLKNKSLETYLHSLDVFILVYMLKPNEKISHYRGALFHDIGKLLTPNEVLAKKSSLTDEEYEIIKKHTLHGEEILLKLGYVEESQIAKLHHEHNDGTGYYGLVEEQLSPILKLVGIVDVYSALTLKRSYKVPFTNQEAFKILYSSKDSYDNKLLRGFSSKCLK